MHLALSHLRPPRLQDKWCIFDAAVCAISVTGVLVDTLTLSSLPFLPLLRVLRVLRVLRIIPRARRLGALLRTMVFSLPALGEL